MATTGERRSPAQMMRALGTANTTRARRAQTKRGLRALGREGALLLADFVLESPSWLRTVYVWQLVQWAAKVGDGRARSMLQAASIDPWRRVGQLTERQRAALAFELRRHADGFTPPPERPLRPRRAGGRPQCANPECREYMIEPSDDGLCGFCLEERAA